MTARDRTERFKELRRLYQPHSIKIKDISTYLRSAATTIHNRANSKLSKTKMGRRLNIKDPYNSDDSQEGKSLLKHASTTRNDVKRRNNSSDSDDLSSSSDDEKIERKKLPQNMENALQSKPLWMQLLSDIDDNISMIQNQCMFYLFIILF